jgi:hypothetical protein
MVLSLTKEKRVIWSAIVDIFDSRAVYPGSDFNQP